MAVTLIPIDDNEVWVGEGEKIILLEGTELHTRNLTVYIIPDANLEIQQPHPDDISATLFPMKVTAKKGAAAGPRDVLIKKSGEELDDQGGCGESKTCFRLDNGIVVKSLG